MGVFKARVNRLFMGRCASSQAHHLLPPDDINDFFNFDKIIETNDPVKFCKSNNVVLFMSLSCPITLVFLLKNVDNIQRRSTNALYFHNIFK